MRNSNVQIIPELKRSAIRSALAQIGAQSDQARLAGRPWQVTGYEVAKCEDGKTVMIYGDTGSDHWLAASAAYPWDHEQWQDWQWHEALQFVLSEPSPRGGGAKSKALVL